MHGSLLTERKTTQAHSAVGRSAFALIAISLSAGIVTALVIAHVRLRLGLPGHKALLWMTPLILTRLLTGYKPSASIASVALVTIAFAFGTNLAGGPFGAPLIILAAALLDTVITRLEDRKTSALLQIPLIALAAMAANLICLGKRILLPAGIVTNPAMHTFGAKLFTYALCGFAAGLTAATIAYILKRRSHQ